MKEGAARCRLTCSGGSARPYVGATVRGRSLSGDNKQAVVYARKALVQAPDDASRRNLENLIEQ